MALLACATGLLVAIPAWQRAPTEVDLAIVLAVDVSPSMDPDEQDLQRQGYVEAFRSPLVQEAIGSGMRGRIAVTYVEWAGTRIRYENIVVPWSILEKPEDALAFADRLARAPMHSSEGTSIAHAIKFSAMLLWTGDFLAARRVIDISGDGPNNQGSLVTNARDEAVARGITINGLPILIKAQDWREGAPLDAYYRDCVIGGPDAFMVPIRERSQFLTETRTKIIREVAGWSTSRSLIQLAQSLPLTDCDTSESLWDDPAFEPEAQSPAAGTERNRRAISNLRWWLPPDSALGVLDTIEIRRFVSFPPILNG